MTIIKRHTHTKKTNKTNEKKRANVGKNADSSLMSGLSFDLNAD